METKDHFQLARWLLRSAQQPLHLTETIGFVLGSLLPDYNPFTYLEGVFGHQGLHGHNAEITQKRVCRILKRTQEKGITGFLPSLKFGIAMHYLADAFTYPHHAYYHGTIKEHIIYEKKLHLEFTVLLRHVSEQFLGYASDISDYTKDMQLLYGSRKHTQISDCKFITNVCQIAFDTMLNRKKCEVCEDESIDYERLVLSVR